MKIKKFKKLAITTAAMVTTLFSAGISANAMGTYTVAEGDNLSGISLAVYGSSDNWSRIFDSNRDAISDPNLIYPGMELAIPELLTVDEFYALDGQSAYDQVKASSDSWVVDSYDLITPENVKDTVVATASESGGLHFNLDWPSYGGYRIDTIASIGELSGQTAVSRIGGNGGYSICYGANDDGTEFTAAQRAIPSSSISYRSGVMNIDLYKSAIDAITSSGDAEAALEQLGFSAETAEKMISDYAAFFNRSEMAGDNSILDGITLSGKSIDSKYGFYGIAAPWQSGSLNLSGGARQMTIAFSFGTMIESGIISGVN